MPMTNKTWSIVVVAILSIGLFALALAARLPLYGSNSYSPDAAEYLSVARKVAAGEGLTMTIKWHYFDDKPVIHSVIGDRPVLFPLIMGIVLRVTGNERSLQGINLLLGSLNASLIFLLAARLAGPAFGSASGLLVALGPRMLLTSKFLWTEQLYLTTVCLALLVFVRFKSPSAVGLAGGLISLAFLTRPEGLISAAMMLVVLILEKRWHLAASFAAGFVLISMPYMIANTATNGTPLFTTVAHHFRVDRFSEGMYAGYGKSFPSAAEFFVNNTEYIAETVRHHGEQYFLEMVRNQVMYLFPFVLLFGSWLKKRGASLVLTLGAASFALASVTWATFDAERLVLVPSVMFGIVGSVNVQGLFERFRHTRPWVSWLMAICFGTGLALTISSYVSADSLLYVSAAKEKLSGPVPAVESAAKWIADNTERNTVIAARHPWPLSWSTGRPTLILPDVSNEEQFRTLGVTYGFSYVVLERPPNDAVLLQWQRGEIPWLKLVFPTATSINDSVTSPAYYIFEVNWQ